MIVKCNVLIAVLVVYYFVFCECKYGYITWVGPKAEITISDYYADIPEVHVAKAMYSNEINNTGWAFLEIHTSEEFPDEKQAYAAGFLEGYLSRDLVWMHWQNMLKGYCFNKTDVCAMIEDFLNKNEEFLLDMVKQNSHDPYWYQLKLYYIQLEGLAMGYNDATENQYEYLTVRDIIWLNMLGDLDELAMALTMPRETPAGYLFGADHCTGLVKLLPDHSDLYFSQVTWNSYQSMLRLQKMYALNYRLKPTSNKRIPGRKMALSSYPGMIQSTDDFYVMSSGLAAAETTIGNSNRSLYDHVKPCGSVMEYARAMIANRLARCGQEWTEIFKRYNSGTYNNQWYIVDYNKFQARAGGTPGDWRPGLLWVLEQLPGYIQAEDLTQILVTTSYWPSYNIPYFPRVFNLSGGWERVRVFGDWFGYNTCPRGHIVKEQQAHIQNIRDMFSFLRYNDFKFDPLARVPGWVPPYNAANAVAARFDLNPPNGTYPIMYLGHRSHGATDAKLTSAHLIKSLQFIAVASPTYNITRGIPPFMWSNFDLGPSLSHVGQPDLWMFSPILHQWEWT